MREFGKTEVAMLRWLKEALDRVAYEKETYGDVRESMVDSLIGAKEMTESVLGVCVGLGIDGVLRLGIEGEVVVDDAWLASHGL